MQHSGILEENQQLWNAVAHINATLHAGRAALLAEAATALQHEQYQQLRPSHQSQELDPSAAGTMPAAGGAPASEGISPPCLDDHDDDEDLFSASPDPMCLAEACGMLFSPAPAAGKAGKLLGGKQQRQGAAVKAAGSAAVGAAGPANKPRKLFEDELAAAAAGCCPADEGVGGWEAGLQLLEDLPHLEFVH